MKHWIYTAPIVATLTVALVAGLFFWHTPSFNLKIRALQGAAVMPAPTPEANPGPYLTTLADNQRVTQHEAAASHLLVIGGPQTLTQLMEMSRRVDLASRPLVVRLLGDLGDDQALPVLEELAGGVDTVIADVAVHAMTQVGTGQAEVSLMKIVNQPSRGGRALPIIAAVRNDVAANVVSACLAKPLLRPVAMDQIARQRLDGCIRQLAIMATDRTVPEADRLRAVETLGQFRCAEARHALGDMLQDSDLGWKARQILNQRSSW